MKKIMIRTRKNYFKEALSMASIFCIGFVSYS